MLAMFLRMVFKGKSGKWLKNTGQNLPHTKKPVCEKSAIFVQNTTEHKQSLLSLF